MFTEFHFGKKLVEALSDETRIGIVRILSNGDRYIGELEQFFPVCREILDQHLAILRTSNLITMKVEDSMVYYAIHPSSINIVQNFLANKKQTAETRANAFYFKSQINETCLGF